MAFRVILIYIPIGDENAICGTRTKAHGKLAKYQYLDAIDKIYIAWDEPKGDSHLVSGKLHFDSRRPGDVSVDTRAGYEKGVGETNDHPACESEIWGL